MRAGRSEVRIGVLGCGAIASTYHLRELPRIPGVSVVAVADPDLAAAAAAARLTGAQAHDDPAVVLGQADLDALVIAAPTSQHADLAVAAAAAGKHFYLEKPIASSEAEAWRVVRAAEEAGIVAAMGFNRRLHPLYEQARAVLRAGRIGPVREAQTAFCEPADPEEMGPWKRRRETGGGVLLDLASHHFDLLRWLLGDELEVVAAGTSSELTEQDGAWTRISTSSGAEASSVFSFRCGHADFLELVGERGTLRVDRHRGALDLRVRRRSRYGVRPGWPRPSRGVVAWQLRRFAGAGGEPSYRRSLRAFVERVRGRSSGETASLDDGLRSLQTVLSAERAAGASTPSAPA